MKNYMVSMRDLLYIQNTNSLKVKWWKKMFHENSYERKAWMIYEYQTNQTLKVTKVTKSIEEHYNINKRFNNQFLFLINLAKGLLDDCWNGDWGPFKYSKCKHLCN